MTINRDNASVKKIITEACSPIEEKIAPLRNEINQLNSSIEEARKTDEKADTSKNEAKVAELRKQQGDIIAQYATTIPTIKQIIDLSLLQSGLLKAQSLDDFIRRSYSLL